MIILMPEQTQNVLKATILLDELVKDLDKHLAYKNTELCPCCGIVEGHTFNCTIMKSKRVLEEIKKGL